MKLLSIKMLIPNRNIEWAITDFGPPSDDPRFKDLKEIDYLVSTSSFWQGTLWSRVDLLDYLNQNEVRKTTKIKEDDSLEVLFRGSEEIVKRIRVNEELFPQISYLVFINAYYYKKDGHSIYVDSFRKIDDVFTFLYENSVNCIHRDRISTIADYIRKKVSEEVRVSVLKQLILNRQCSAHATYHGIDSKTNDHCFIFDDWSSITMTPDERL